MNTDFIRIQKLCEKNKVARKLVIIPSIAIKGQLLKALNDNGIEPLNLTFHTVTSLAMEISQRKIVEENLKIIDFTQSVDAVSDIIAQAKQKEELVFFSRLENTLGLSSVITTTVIELLMSGYDSNSLSLVENENKKKDIEYIIEKYIAFKKDNKLFDVADIVLEAVSQTDAKDFSFEYEYAIALSTCRFSAVEKKLIDNLNIEYTEAEEVESISLNASNIGLTAAQGCYAEVKAVIRDIIEKGIPFDNVLIVSAQKRPYDQLLYQIMQQYTTADSQVEKKQRNAVTFGSGLPLAIATPTKLLLSLLDWIDGGYKMHDLITIFASGEIDMKSVDYKPQSDDKISRVQIINGIKKSEITWQRQTYLPAIERYIEENKDREYYAKRIDAMKWLYKLLDESFFVDIPVPDENGNVNMNEFCNGLYNIVKKHKKIRNILDTNSVSAIEGILRPSLSNRVLKEREITSIIRERIKQVYVGVESPSEGKIHFTSYKNADYIDRPYTYLIGLNASIFPGMAVEDPVLLDSERNDNLVKSYEKIDDNISKMYSFISGVNGNLYVSYSSYDTQEKRELYPATVFNQIAELAGNPEVKKVELKLNNDIMKLDEEDFWIPTAKAKGPVAMENERYKYDEDVCFIPDALSLDVDSCESVESYADLTKNGRITSASSLNDYLKCKYKYYLKNVMGLPEIGSDEVDTVGWLNSFEVGHIYHAVFEKFCKKVKNNRNYIDDFDLATETILDLAQNEIIQYEERLPAASKFHTETQKETIRENCLRFIDIEYENKNRAKPEQFEYEFGNEGDECPIEIAEGRQLKVTGKVDRIDSMDDGSWLLTDYKTGKDRTYQGIDNQGSALVEGNLQLLLYYLALKSLKEKREDIADVSRLEYRFVTEKGNYSTHGIDADKINEEAIRIAFGELVKKIANAVFMPCTFVDKVDEETGEVTREYVKQGLCKYCGFYSICKYAKLAEV